MQFSYPHPFVRDGFICVYKEDSFKELSKRDNSIVLDNGTVVRIDGTLISASEGIGLVEYEGKDGEYKGKKLFEFITSQGEIYKYYRNKDGKEYPFLDVEPCITLSQTNIWAKAELGIEINIPLLQRITSNICLSKLDGILKSNGMRILRVKTSINEKSKSL